MRKIKCLFFYWRENLPEDDSRWQGDVTAFCPSLYKFRHGETLEQAREYLKVAIQIQYENFDYKEDHYECGQVDGQGELVEIEVQSE